MKSSSSHPLIIALCFSILAGCVSIQETNSLQPVVRTTQKNNAATTKSGSARSYIGKATAYETKGNLRMALYYLNIASSVSSEKKELGKKITELQNRIDKKADRYFKKGRKLYRNNQMDKARLAFLNCLRCDPEHKKALYYLNAKFSPFKVNTYKVKKGDTKTEIAEKIFLDPDKAFLISYFYEETADQDVLQKDMTMDLPYLASIPVTQSTKQAPQPKKSLPPVQESKIDQTSSETPPPVQATKIDQPPSEAPSPSPLEKAFLPVFNVESELARAEGLLKEKRYDRAMMIADKILDHDYLNMEAERLINRVYFQKGKSLFHRKRYLEAQTIFGYVDPDYIHTQEVLAEIKTVLLKQAESHYLKGVKYFINEELENAILEWETVLKMNPDHGKAASDIKDAKHLLQKLQEVE